MTDFYKYKGLPLVRKGNLIYWGNMSDEYIIHIIVQSANSVAGAAKKTASEETAAEKAQTAEPIQVADKVIVKLMSTTATDAAKAYPRTANVSGLSEAFKTGYEWIEKFCPQAK